MKQTPLSAPVIDVIHDRWSGFSFDSRPLPDEQIASLLEAARWAASSFGEEPWRYVYASTGDAGRSVLDWLLLDGNAWARKAGLLIVGFTKKTFAHNWKINRHSMYDAGAATMQLVLQATSMGLATHQMGGFHHESAHSLLDMSDDYEPTAMIAIGYPWNPDELDEKTRARHDAPRERMNTEEMSRRLK